MRLSGVPSPAAPEPLTVRVVLAAALVVSLAVDACIVLLTGQPIVQDRVGCLLVAMGGVLYQQLLGLLEAIRLASTRLLHRSLGGVLRWMSAAATDEARFPCSLL